jgi:hypothetical protein
VFWNRPVPNAEDIAQRVVELVTHRMPHHFAIRPQDIQVLCPGKKNIAGMTVRIANDSEYGLSGGVWSSDEAHALDVARRIRTGTVTVNGASVAFDGPFGGFKASGIGREYGAVGLGTCTEYKTVTI